MPTRGVTISVLGSVRVAIHGREIPFPKRKARALLAYLVLTEGHQDTRERLGGLLWSEVSEARARTSLRQELHQVDEILRKAGSLGLVRDRLRVMLRDRVEAVDANQILSLARHGTIHPKLVEEPLISDSFLRDIDDVDPAFATWARARRQSFHDQLLASLESILRSTDLDRAQRRGCAQAILNLDPTHEEACRVFMRLSAEAGDPMAAQRAYNALYALLDKDYDAEPTSETIELVAAIKQGRVPPVADPVAATSSGPTGSDGVAAEPSATSPGPVFQAHPVHPQMVLLVEPFGMNGIAPDDQHLVEGFRHELLACLVRFREWSVISPASRGDAVLEAGLPGALTVSATAYRAGDLISMVVTLHERDTGLHLWGNRYTLTLDGWFEAQQDIVRQIAVALNVEVSAARLRRIADQPDISLEAHDLWLRAEAAMLQFDRSRWDSGRRMYLAAIERAPDFARGYSGLAQMTYAAHVVHPGRVLSDAEKDEALALARRAVALDPMDPRSQLTLGWCLSLKGRFQAASVHLDLARDLNPNDTWVMASAALCHALSGALASAERLVTQIRRVMIAPSRLHAAWLAMIAFIAGDYLGAIEMADLAREVLLPAIAWQAAAYALSGQAGSAQETAARFIVLAREHWAADDPATLASIGRWLLSMLVFARIQDWQRLRDGLAEAGIPPGGSVFRG